MAIETNRRVFYPNGEIELQLEAAGIEHLEDVTGRYSDDLFPSSYERWQIGNLRADLTDLEIPTRLLKANDVLLRCAYIDLNDDKKMYLYGCGMSWAYPHHFLKEFPHKVIEKIVPNQSSEYIPILRTDTDYISAARRVFESLYCQNSDRILAAEFIETEDDQELAGIYLNMGEYDYIYPRDGYLDDEDQALAKLFEQSAYQNLLPPISSSDSSLDISSRSASTSLSAATSEFDELSMSGEDSKSSSPAPTSSQTPSPDLQRPIPKKEFIVKAESFY